MTASTLRALFPAVAALGIACGVTVLVPVVFNYLGPAIAADLRISKPAVSGALSLYLGMQIFSLPLAGVIADRIGTRPLIVVSALAFGIALWLASRAAGIGQLYVTFAIAGVVGAGASPITYARAIVHRFAAHRGLALGVALSGGGLAGIVLPQLIRPVVEGDGWRSAVMLLAALAVVVGVATGLLSGDARDRRSSAAAASGMALRDAVRTRAFLTMTLAFACFGTVLSGVTSHLTEIWQAVGLPAADVPRYQAVAGTATIICRLAGGALMDRIPARYVGAGAAVIGAGGVLLLSGGQAAGPMALLVGVAIGLCTGTESDVVSFLSSQFFGLRNFARIYGVQAACFMIGFAAGPVLFALAATRAGYPLVLAVGAVVLFGSGLALATLRAPTTGRTGAMGAV